jgi:polypeptide N-acetylgalactosaminyltransferase
MEIGDLSARKELRKKLRCKNFKWFLDNVYSSKYIPDENVIAYGRVCTNFCMKLGGKNVFILRCVLNP